MNNSESTLPAVAVEQPPEKKAKTDESQFYHLLRSAGKDLTKHGDATEFVGCLNDKQMDMLLAKIIERKQKETNDKDVVVFQNPKNKTKMQYLQIRSSRVENTESFEKSKWLKRAVEISCTSTRDKAQDKANQHESAKRITKKLMKMYPASAKEAIEELKVWPKERKMSALKMAAMFKAAQINTVSKRRFLLRHLRHHFGKKSFDREINVQKLWDGHSEPNPEIAPWIAQVDKDSCTGPRKSEEEKAEEEQQKKEQKRKKQLQWENGMLFRPQAIDGMPLSPPKPEGM